MLNLLLLQILILNLFDAGMVQLVSQCVALIRGILISNLLTLQLISIVSQKCERKAQTSVGLNWVKAKMLMTSIFLLADSFKDKLCVVTTIHHIISVTCCSGNKIAFMQNLQSVKLLESINWACFGWFLKIGKCFMIIKAFTLHVLAN